MTCKIGHCIYSYGPCFYLIFRYYMFADAFDKCLADCIIIECKDLPIFHHNWAQADQRFVCKWAETARRIREQKEETGRNSLGYIQTWMFAHQIRAQSNQQFVYKCPKTARTIRGQKQHEFSGVKAKFNQAWGFPLVICPIISSSVRFKSLQDWIYFQSKC